MESRDVSLSIWHTQQTALRKAVKRTLKGRIWGRKRWLVGNVLAARRLYGFCVMRIGRAREFVPRYFKYFHVQIFA